MTPKALVSGLSPSLQPSLEETPVRISYLPSNSEPRRPPWKAPQGPGADLATRGGLCYVLTWSFGSFGQCAIPVPVISQRPRAGGVGGGLADPSRREDLAGGAHGGRVLRRWPCARAAWCSVRPGVLPGPVFHSPVSEERQCAFRGSGCNGSSASGGTETDPPRPPRPFSGLSPGQPAEQPCKGRAAGGSAPVSPSLRHGVQASPLPQTPPGLCAW